MTSPHSQTPLQPGALALWACAVGILSTGLAVLAVVATGLLPTGTAAFVLYGFGAAALTGGTGIAVLSYLATLRPREGQVTAEKVTQLYLMGLVGNLLLQFVAAGIGIVAVFWIDEKFQSATAFGLAFASTATLLQIGGSIVISRALLARSRSLEDDGPVGDGVDGVNQARDPGTS